MSLGLARGNTDLLFCRVDWFSVDRVQRQAIDREIESYHSEKLLNTSDDTLLDYFVTKFRMDVPHLQRDGVTVDQQETQIDVSRDPHRFFPGDRRGPFYVAGTVIEVEVPFSGDENFFFVQPTTFGFNPPRGNLRGGSLFFSLQGERLDALQVKQTIEETLAEIETHLDRLRASAEQFNQSIAPHIQGKLAVRKTKLLADRNLVANLGFPMRRREGTAATYASPQIRKKIAPVQPPPASSAPFAPEPALVGEQYENILDILTNMVRVMECSPSAFAEIDEEALRTHFLVQLNGHFEGQASGETFNYEGKTDILIKDKGRNIFVAECKFWRGEKAYGETIDQLLGYLTWRDTKSAILVFNRNRDFTSVLDKARQATEAHPNFRKFLRQRSESSWVFRFAHRDDPDRQMTVTVMAFDIPQKP